jgi:hypothetical protein
VRRQSLGSTVGVVSSSQIVFGIEGGSKEPVS